MFPKITAANTMPADGYAGTLIGRAWFPGLNPGPCVVVIREDGVHNISGTIPTMSELLNEPRPLAAAIKATRNCVNLGSVDDVLANSTPDTRDPLKPYFLSPIDLQAVKACGMTYAKSILLRVIEEHAQGDEKKEKEIRKTLEGEIGGEIATVEPGSEEAKALKEALIDMGLWSQYLEAGIGPYVEVFTKAQPLSSVGSGSEIGIHSESRWSHSEPEAVIITNGEGRPVGATLGNDVNLHDVEELGSLYLSRAKDNNGSCAIGPFIRLFDNTFSLEDTENMSITITIEREDGFMLTETFSTAEMTREMSELVGQTLNRNHQYPDGLALFTGTMYFPAHASAGVGERFTHKVGDVVTISSPQLGKLVNRVNTSDKLPPWNFGIADLMNNLAHRHLF